jgi:hypothetical protein
MPRLSWPCIGLCQGTFLKNRVQLSLHHGNTKIAQLRVEEWIAVAPPPFPYQTDVNGVKDGDSNGATKPKDYYDKIVESYCLFLLPRNEEWDFAIIFIGKNEYLSESRKKVCQTATCNLTSDISFEAHRPQSCPDKRERKSHDIFTTSSYHTH